MNNTEKTNDNLIQGVMIRHGKTKGNLEHRYVGGKTDIPLAEEGILALKDVRVPEAEIVFISPMIRCLETAEILYPGIERVVIEGFRECDFGDFENKTADELLTTDPRYQAWVDAGGGSDFPGGESMETFQERSCLAFEESVSICMARGIRRAAWIFHGGSVMAILGRYGVPKQEYYDYQVKNGRGYKVAVRLPEIHYEVF